MAVIPVNAKTKPSADVLLVLEGTYPYVRGGVSSWVHQLISGLPEFSFSLLFIGGNPKSYGERLYSLPDNVVGLDEYYLSKPLHSVGVKRKKGCPKAFTTIEALHDQFHETEAPDADLFNQAVNLIGNRRGVTYEDFMFSEASWQSITDAYHKYGQEPAFVDYFWTVRAIHNPLFTLAEIAQRAPTARVVHSISTGYAGYLAALIRKIQGCPYMLTEHGIYTKERKIDLTQADWISDRARNITAGLNAEMSHLRKMWIRFYEELGRFAYGAADPIIALYEGNRARQVIDGAQHDKTRVIPNGIEVEKYAQALAERSDETPRVIGLIGRVVPIKDIKTFIRAMRTVCQQLPNTEGWIIGPTDEDPEYVKECENLIASLGLNDRVKMLGFRNVAEVLPKIGVMVLTSISEALPLVVLEAFAGGVPVLSTDVGACRELVEGGNEQDKKLGMAGAIVPIADPEATARHAILLLNNAERWKKAQLAGLKRVSRYYTQAQFFDAYRNLYQKALDR